jgi:hypothetical protein
VVAVVTLSGNRRLEHSVVALSMGSLAAYSVEPLGIALPTGWIGSAGYQILGSLLTLAPCAALGFKWLVFERAAGALRQPARDLARARALAEITPGA